MANKLWAMAIRVRIAGDRTRIGYQTRGSPTMTSHALKDTGAKLMNFGNQSRTSREIPVVICELQS